jgi:hypothetical protein
VFDGADAAAASIADEPGRLVVPLLVQVIDSVFQRTGIEWLYSPVTKM